MDAIKFKQTTRNSVKAVTTTFNEWRKPLARQLNKDGDVSCVTIRVRILNGDSESDFNARFPPGPLLAKSVCKAIQNKQGLSEDEAKLFGLWMIGKDIELQVRPTLDLFELILFWHNWVTKYTHVPEAANPSHPVNNYWLVYRREALVSIAEEKQNAGQKAISLLYGEAKRNIMSGKYVCTQMAFATIAGIQQQILHGDYDQSKTPIGYLSDIERLQQLLPDKAANKMSASEWEKIITLQYKTFIGLDASEARKT
ncbi:hypothetical protein BC833DRAFT_613962 [Globomyces pollinis-pini]|nr:hypothetical protein BC833DRAFT_613962 [Globomyces pollinis-pini]